jgi:isoleucyl-tRNA synthetase
MDEKGEKMSKSKGNVTAPQDVMKDAGADILRLWVMTSDYAEDLRVGKTIIQTNIDAYRKIRNTIRWMLGTLAHDHGDEIDYSDLPDLEKLMLHRLAELDLLVREAYDAFDFKKAAKALSDFANVELSAFYFDIRKDTLYCDAPSSLKRRSALFVIRKLFDSLVLWFAPMMPFTTDEAWLSRNPSAVSVHLEQFPVIPDSWKNEAVADKWKKIRQVRRAVTGALEIERKDKRIGSSLEAAPVVYIADAGLFSALEDQDFAEICITSDIRVNLGEGPADAFRADDVAHVSVIPALAEGTKCARSWRITTDVGSDPDYPDVSARDAAALRELAALAV